MHGKKYILNCSTFFKWTFLLLGRIDGLADVHSVGGVIMVRRLVAPFIGDRIAFATLFRFDIVVFINHITLVFIKALICWFMFVGSVSYLCEWWPWKWWWWSRGGDGARWRSDWVSARRDINIYYCLMLECEIKRVALRAIFKRRFLTDIYNNYNYA